MYQSIRQVQNELVIIIIVIIFFIENWQNAVSYIERDIKSKSSQYISLYSDRVIKVFIDQVS